MFQVIHKQKNYFIGTLCVKIKETNLDNILPIFESIQSAEIISKIVSECNAYTNRTCKQKFISVLKYFVYLLVCYLINHCVLIPRLSDEE